jgi:hypothetical protein
MGHERSRWVPVRRISGKQRHRHSARTARDAGGGVIGCVPNGARRVRARIDRAPNGSGRVRWRDRPGAARFWTCPLARSTGCRTVLDVSPGVIDRVPHGSGRVRGRDRPGAARFWTCPRARSNGCRTVLDVSAGVIEQVPNGAGGVRAPERVEPHGSGGARSGDRGRTTRRGTCSRAEQGRTARFGRCPIRRSRSNRTARDVFAGAIEQVPNGAGRVRWRDRTGAERRGMHAAG